MDNSGYKVRGEILLRSRAVRKRTITVTGTPFGLMTGKFKLVRGGVWHHAVKAEGENFTTRYEVGCDFPALVR